MTDNNDCSGDNHVAPEFYDDKGVADIASMSWRCSCGEILYATKINGRWALIEQKEFPTPQGHCRCDDRNFIAAGLPSRVLSASWECGHHTPAVVVVVKRNPSGVLEIVTK